MIDQRFRYSAKEADIEKVYSETTDLGGNDWNYLARVERRLRKGDNVILLFVGDPNSGKSMFALANALHFDKALPIEKNVHHSVETFLDNVVMDDLENEVIFIEEAGNNFGSLDRLNNEFFSKFAQISRRRHNLYILVLPDADDLAPKVKKYCRIVIEMRKTESNGVCAKAYRINKWLANVTSKRSFSSQPILDEIIKIKMPPKEFVDRYEELEKPRKNEIDMKIKDRKDTAKLVKDDKIRRMLRNKERSENANKPMTKEDLKALYNKLIEDGRGHN